MYCVSYWSNYAVKRGEVVEEFETYVTHTYYKLKAAQRWMETEAADELVQHILDNEIYEGETFMGLTGEPRHIWTEI